jgi:hypothetical protein
LHIDEALPILLARIPGGGPEAEEAAQTAAHLGTKATQALKKLMAEVAPGLRRRIASAFAIGNTASAETAAVEALLDTDPSVVDAACRTLLAKVPELEAAHRRKLSEQARTALGRPASSRLPAFSEAALIRLLAGLEDPKGEPLYWQRIDGPTAPELRAAALAALGTLRAPCAGDKVKRLLACAADNDFRVAAPALMILKNVPLNKRLLRHWLELFSAADAAPRRLAMEKLGALDQPEIASCLLEQLDHPDRAVRDQAFAALARLKHGRAALAEALLEADAPEKAWALARVQAPLARDYPLAIRGRLFTQACECLEKGDRRADPLLFLLREIDARALAGKIEDRALALRKKKQFASALVYLKLLVRDPASSELIRFELVSCGLKVSEKDLAAEARAADPCLRQLAGLVERRSVDPLDLLKKAKWLGPEDLFYVGFHFVEGRGSERDFGAEVLRLVSRRSPRSQVGRAARNKLINHGLK